MTWAFGLLALAVLAWALAERRRRPMDRAARAAAPGRIADLPSGGTHYRWDGPTEGPVAVVIHGISIGSSFMDEVAAILAGMGFRVLRYDLYGRGLSDRPGGAQDRAFFVGQLRALLDYLGFDGPVTLVGHSMGGAIATAFAAEASHRVNRLVLLTAAGLGERTPLLFKLVRDVPVVGDWLMRVGGGLAIRRIARTLGRDQGISGEVIEAQCAETRYRGFLPAILSSLRHFLRDDLAVDHRKVARTGLPVLAMWAEEDEVILRSVPGRLAEINRDAMQVVVPGATHALPVTHVRDIREALREFLRAI
ncbi:Lysophospholipase, alpha-beta hydrolase superfamily [Rhodovulum sp. ES.010]|uniref:alpha/beta fold hydrolase n=1 Tax=Rhodovulum sp. ES.010 TaxID=1882821 RepID=UPI0009284E4A|nr:alpha/beta hydrolase [Rhodovulum sp. ES.010]SIO51746.1 Lysophospholipase, alpha-beta hydrolase superfamily [Rhodovulum sp. ES.010]